MARIVEYCGIRAVAGLSWDLAQPGVALGEGLKSRTLGRIKRSLATPPASVHLWDGRRAELADRKTLGLPALSRVVLELISEDMRDKVVLVAIAEPDADLYTSFVLASGKPVLGPERLYADVAELRTAIGELITTGGIEIIACSDALDGMDGASLPVFALHQTDLDPRSLPVSVPGRAPLRTAVAVAGSAGAILMAASFFAEDIQDLISPPEAHERIIAARVPDWTAFSRGCLAAHAEEWPSVPGWRPFSRGCKIVAPGQPAVAWRTFRLEGGRNLIISQRVAEMMYRDWPHRMNILDASLETETDIALTWTDMLTPTDPTIPPIARQAEDAFVGIERSISQDGASVEPSVVVLSDAPLQDVLSRTSRLSSYWIDKIEQNERGTELVLRNAPQPVAAPGGSQ